MPFRTKICGITSIEDALMLADVGVDAIGLNFYERSKRYITPQQAAEIVKQLPSSVKLVGVFVNASSESVIDIAHTVGLDYVQLHGDEPPQFLSRLDGLAIIRAFRCNDGLEPVARYLSDCEVRPTAVLVDAYDPHEYGGTGKTLAWSDLAEAGTHVGDLPLILAGGLTPENVSMAIEQASPYGVDTASGVEKKPQIKKDKELCAAFVSSAIAAFSKQF